LTLLVGNASPLTDPVQCAGDPGEASRQSQGATIGGHKGGNAHQCGSLFGDQRTTGIAEAGGSAVGSTGAKDLIGDRGGSVKGDALRVGHYLEVNALQRIGQAIIEGSHSPSTDVAPPVFVTLGSGTQRWKGNLVDPAGEANPGNPDQGKMLTSSNTLKF